MSWLAQDQSKGLFSWALERTPISPGEPMTHARILIVEDESIIARDIQDRLEGMEYAVAGIAATGPDAIQLAADMRPDLVLMDIQLAGDMDGIEAAQEIGARFDIPVIYLTGYADDLVLQRAKVTGPFGYLLKPLEPLELHSTIEMALYKHQVEKDLRQRNRELDTLNRVSLLFNSSLDQDQVLVTVLEEVRRLLNVAACSIWLTSPDRTSIVCRQTTGPGGDIVRGWQLALGEGIVGWVALHGESLIVSDLEGDERHFTGIDQQTGVIMRSLISVPMRIKDNTIGVIQIADTRVNRFTQMDLTLVEPLGAAAAIAIENARLYRETDRLRAFNENIVQGMQEGILIEDAEGRITFANPKAADLLAYPPHSLIGKHWASIVSPRDLDAVRLESAKRSKGIVSRYEATLLTRDGRELPAIISARPLFDLDRFNGVLSVFTDISERAQAEKEREALIGELQEALAKVKTLSGMLPICSSCKKIRDDQGYWHRVEEYIQEHSEADFSHGLCPECAHRLYPDIFDEDEETEL
jgi:PAS domain S-box-containing protein